VPYSKLLAICEQGTRSQRRFVLVLESGRAEWWSDGPPASLREALRAGVWEHCAKSELHPSSGLGWWREGSGLDGKFSHRAATIFGERELIPADGCGPKKAV